MRRHLWGTIMAIGLVASAASAERWECRFPGQTPDGWLRGQVFVIVPGETSDATVFDSLINSLHAGPIGARVSANNDKRTTIKWVLKNVKLRQGYAPTIYYTLTHLKPSGQATFFAIAPSMSNYRNSYRAGGNFSAKGRCQVK